MGSRLDLQTELEGLLGNRHVYFQPPESKKFIIEKISGMRMPITTIIY